MKIKNSLRLAALAGAALMVILTLWLSNRSPQRSRAATTATEVKAILRPPAIDKPVLSKPSAVDPRTAAPTEPSQEISASTTTVSDAKPSPNQVLAEFRDWLMRFEQANDSSAKARLQADGTELAQQRQKIMARLIEEDPQQALQEAVTYAQRQSLPAPISALLEQPISGRGDLDVLGVLPDPEMENQSSGIVRTVHLGGKDYRAFVYGRRLSHSTAQNIPLHGVVLGDAMAVHQSPVRVLDAAEAVARAAEVAPENAQCPVSKKSISVEDAAAVVDVGGLIRILCNGGHIEVLEGELLAAEGAAPSGEAVAAALDSWSQGPKTLLYIRVKFSDQASDPQTLTDSQNMMNSVNNFFVENSYDTTTITTTFTPVYTLSNNTAYYNSNGIYTLRSDALALATANGYNYANWNLDAVRYNGGPGAFSGAAYVHARGCWLKSSSAGVASHEFGHNYGLWHANSWNPTDDSPIGPGTWQEYGDSFDTMGAASAGAYHFNARFKTVLNWIPPEGYLTASASGTYRVYAHDYITSSNQIRGLRVPRDANKNYWVEFRQKFTGNTWLMNGAGIRRMDNANNNSPGSELLDMTPGSPDGKSDSALLIGRTFSDSSAGVHITPVGKGGTSPESLEVVVNLGTFSGNNSPSLTINASATAVATGSPVAFTAAASDGDGDTVGYHWDFGDKTYGLNTATPSKSWSTAGEYVVRCVVSDMKGGTASRWIVITVGSPSTFRIGGRVTDGLGTPMEGARVHNGLTGSSYRGCYTDVDGYYTIANLAASSYTVGAAFYGYTFAASGFSNPVAVGPSKTGINFVGAPKTYTISGRVTDGGVGVSGVQVSDGSRTGTSNSNGDYTISNVPNGSYTLTATKAGYVFNPSGWSNPVVVNDANVTGRDFVTPTYTVSGEITGVAVTTVVTVTDGYRTTTSFKQGSGPNAKNLYNLSGVPAGSWNLRAILTNASFSPTGFSNPLTVSGNTSSKNFALDAVATYSISGTITYSSVGLPGVTVSAGSRSSITDSRGIYYINGLANGAYTVVPSLSGYSFSPTSASVTISSADVGGRNFAASQVVTPTVTLAVADADASEPSSNTGRFTITRTGSTATGLTVFYGVNGTASPGGDFVALAGSATIPSGASSADITVTPIDDTEAECAETVTVTLTANAAYTIGSPNSGTVTLTDNDLPTVTVVATDSTAAEAGGDTGTFQVTRNGCLSIPLTVNYNVGGSATPGSDFQALSGSVTIPAGISSATITVTPLDDAESDGNETVELTLTSGSYVMGTPGSAIVTITDDDVNQPPQVSAGADQTVSILGLASLSGTVTDDGKPGGGLTYAWSKVSGLGTVVTSDPSAKDTTACFSMPGTYVLALTANDGALSASDDVTITVTAADPAKVINAVNAGGSAYTDAAGIVYRADTWFTGGTANSTGAAIGATADTALYQTERSGDFTYDIPISGGSRTYLVALKFAETTASAAAQRVFDVSVDGTLAADNLDVFSEVGANTAFDIVFPVTASGDILSIQFQTAGSSQTAKVNAIVVGAVEVLSPAAPTGLTAPAASSSQIDLSWMDNSGNETSFQIDVSTDGASYAPLVTLGANVTSYSHTGLSPSTTYHYRVRACNMSGCSSNATASAVTQDGPPAAPSNLTASAVSAAQINLSWMENSLNEDGFSIERSLNGTTFTVIGATGPNVTTFAATGLAKNTRYYFRVRAFNELGSSAYSNTANVRTKPK